MHSHLLWSVVKVLLLIKLLVVGLIVAVLFIKPSPRVGEPLRLPRLDSRK
jgi:hypothetical protein